MIVRSKAFKKALVAQYESGLSINAIAKLHKINAGTIYDILKRNDAKMREKIIARVWTEEIVKNIVRAFNAGITASELGVTYGVSKNAIIGLLTRQRKKGVEVRTQPMAKVKESPRPEITFVSDPRRDSLLNLRSDQCHYPSEEEDQPPYTFCAEPIRPNSSYCPKHHKICNSNRPYDYRA